MQFKEEVLEQLHYILGREQGGPTHYLEGIKDAIKIIEDKWDQNFFYLFQKKYLDDLDKYIKWKEEEIERNKENGYDDHFSADISLSAFKTAKYLFLEDIDVICRELVIGKCPEKNEDEEDFENATNHSERDNNL